MDRAQEETKDRRVWYELVEGLFSILGYNRGEQKIIKAIVKQKKNNQEGKKDETNCSPKVNTTIRP